MKQYKTLPLSSGQRRLWFGHQVAPSIPLYNVCFGVRISGRFEAEILQQSLTALICNHDALHTIVCQVDGAPHQSIEPASACQLERLTLDTGPGSASPDSIRSFVERLASKPFNLESDPLSRFYLVRLAPDDHLLLIVQHHIITDGWSVRLLINELAELYQAFVEEKPPSSPQRLQFREYVEHEAKLLPDLQVERAFWREQLAKVPRLDLAIGTRESSSGSYKGGRIGFKLSSETSATLLQFSQRERCTPFAVLFAIYSVFIHRYTGQEDFAVGTVLVNRRGTRFFKTAGFFANTVPVRCSISGSMNFRQVLHDVSASLARVARHGRLPFHEILQAAGRGKDWDGGSLLQTCFVFQGKAFSMVKMPRGWTPMIWAPDGSVKGISRFELSLILQQGPEGFDGFVEYSEKFDERIVGTISEMLAEIASQLVSNPERWISQLKTVSERDEKCLLYDWNRTECHYPQGHIHDLIAVQSKKTPNAIAVSYEREHLTYSELNERANKLADYLLQMGITPDTRIIVCIERSIEMVVALLGVLKAGAAYVSLQPSSPVERLSYMLQDIESPLLLTTASVLGKLPDQSICSIQLDHEWPLIGGCSGEDPKIKVDGDNIAYVIYTSGTTGRPTGAMNTHKGLVNRIQWMQQEYCLSQGDSVLQKTPFDFDVSVWEFFWPLIVGARLVMLRPGGHQDPAQLASVIEKEQITTLHFVPSMLSVTLETIDTRRWQSVRRIMCSGESLSPQLAKKCLKAVPGAELHNLYGPTEASIDVTSWHCIEGEIEPVVPIGRPIANIRIHVLDQEMALVPPGIWGELYIEGVGIARGYWKRPELTAERFIPNPFASSPDGRLYRTGDQARWDPGRNGRLEFLKRLDQQVKIHGNRVELGEIECLLLEYPEIQEAAVAVRDDSAGNKRIVAYVVRRDKKEGFDPAELRRRLRQKLPEHMIPASWMELQQLPHTPSGKLDRRALPVVLVEGEKNEYEASQNEIEKKMAEIWAEVLHVERVGVQDNFFELGGDSISSIQVRSRSVQEGIFFSIEELLRCQTIRGLARCLEPVRPEDASTEPYSLCPDQDRPKLRSGIEDAYPLSALQTGMLLHAGADPDRPLYHNVNSYQMKMLWDEGMFRDALEVLLQHHRVLRTSFDLYSYSEPLQLVHLHADIPLAVHDLRCLSTA
jgi:amino acid adenylation domain-containing protein